MIVVALAVAQIVLFVVVVAYCLLKVTKRAREIRAEMRYDLRQIRQGNFESLNGFS